MSAMSTRKSPPGRATLHMRVVATRARSSRAIAGAFASSLAFAGSFACACSCALALASPSPAAVADNPPGVAFIPGGRTKVGIDMKELEKLLGADVHSQTYAGSLSAETPRHEVFVDSFWLGVTEVTNEQYAAYVRATGSCPPENWAEGAIRVGRDAFFKEQERLKNEALAQGRPVPDPAQFDAHDWWAHNWRGAAWQIPPGDLHRPVVFVDYRGASSYARWAGLRLPSELEYVRAVRGDSEHLYPWGNEWDNEKYAATSLMKKKSGAFAVGSFPAGASKQGVFDLAGNVWEWTSSPYVAFPGYERKVFEFGFATQKRTVNAVADFNPEQRVVVGGSFQNLNLMARATTRRAADKAQSTDALGFRCAGSIRPGVDLANALLDEELTANVRPREAGNMVAYAPESTIGIDTWSVAPTLAEEGGDGGKPWNPPPGYAVISGHRYALFVPVKTLRATEVRTLEAQCADEGPVAIGFLSTNWRVLEPPLAPGTYFVAYRAKGPRRPPPAAESPQSGAKKPDSAPPVEDVLNIDINFEHLIFTDVASKPLLALPTKLEYVALRDGSVRLADADQVPQTSPTPPQPGEKFATFDLCVPCRASHRGYACTLTLKVAE
jgi:formylglycine-generating enzyme required for sulfatase activity